MRLLSRWAILIMMIICILHACNLPLGDWVVWSKEGPVPNEPVRPACLFQLNVSFESCIKSHKPTSKLHLCGRNEWTCYIYLAMKCFLLLKAKINSREVCT